MSSDFYGFDEIRPGVFVFYDEMQLQIGSCRPDDIALAMVCPVVSVHPARNEATIYGGAVHFSKDFIVKEGAPWFGRMMRYQGETWNPSEIVGFLKAVSQEHGTVKLQGADVNLKPGDRVTILPVHACLTVHLMREDVKVSS